MIFWGIQWWGEYVNSTQVSHTQSSRQMHLPPFFDEIVGDGFCSVLNKTHGDPHKQRWQWIIVIAINNGVYLTFKKIMKRFSL